VTSRIEDGRSHQQKRKARDRGKLRSFLNGIFSTKVRILAAGFAGIVAIAGTIIGILNATGVINGPSPSPSVVNQYYGTLATPPDSGPSEPPANSDCAAHDMGKVGQGQVYVTLTGKLSSNACWSQYLAPVIPGSTARFLISYRNLSHLVQQKVVLRVILPAGFLLVPNSTWLYDGSYPKGIEDTSNNLAEGGLIIGSYYPAATAYVTFSVAVPFGNKMSCGWNDFHPTAIAQPDGMAEFYNRAGLEVAKQC
jgi:hypothetical protein